MLKRGVLVIFGEPIDYLFIDIRLGNFSTESLAPLARQGDWGQGKGIRRHHGHTFRITVPLCRESTFTCVFTEHRPVVEIFSVVRRPNKIVNKHSSVR